MGCGSSISSVSSSEDQQKYQRYGTLLTHRTLLRPVFLQRIHRFAATQVKTPVVFKTVCSAWEDAMNNYTDLSVCWKNLLLSSSNSSNTNNRNENSKNNNDGPSPSSDGAATAPATTSEKTTTNKTAQQQLKDRFAHLFTRLCYLKELDPNSEIEYAALAGDDTLLIAVIRLALYLLDEEGNNTNTNTNDDDTNRKQISKDVLGYTLVRSRRERVPAIKALILYLVSPHRKEEGLSERTLRFFFEHMSIVLSRRDFDFNLDEVVFALGTSKEPEIVSRLGLVVTTLLKIEEESMMMSSPSSSTSSQQVATIVKNSRYEDDDENAKRKATETDQSLVSSIQRQFVQCAGQMTLPALVSYFDAFKNFNSCYNQNGENSSNDNNDNEKKKLDTLHQRLVMFPAFGYEEPMPYFPVFFMVFREKEESTETEKLKYYLDFVEKQGAGDLLRHALVNAKNPAGEGWIPVYLQGGPLGIDGLDLVFNFLAAEKDGQEITVFRKQLYLDKNQLGDNEESEKQRKQKAAEVFWKLVKRCFVPDAFIAFFIELVSKKMNLSDDLLEVLMMNMGDDDVDESDSTRDANPVTKFLWYGQDVSPSSFGTMRAFFEHLCHNNNEIIKKLLHKTHVLLDISKYVRKPDVIELICQKMNELGIYKEEYDAAVAAGANYLKDRLIYEHGYNQKEPPREWGGGLSDISESGDDDEPS